MAEPRDGERDAHNGNSNAKPKTRKICDMKNFDFGDQILFKFDDLGVVGKLTTPSIQIWQN